MENQHRKIKGYRELNQQEIDLMNKIKKLGPQIEAVLLDIGSYLDEQKLDSVNDENAELKDRLVNATPGRFLALAKTNIQTGLMYATRSVEQPEFF